MREQVVNALILVSIILPCSLYWQEIGMLVIGFVALCAAFPIFAVPVILFFGIPRQ